MRCIFFKSSLLRVIVRTVFALALSAPAALAQQVTISGVVIDGQSGEPLREANVFIPGLAIGTVSNAGGAYRLQIPVGTHDIRYSYVGYETASMRLEVLRDTTIDVRLEVSGLLDEVLVRADDETDMLAPALGVSRLEIREAQRLPAFMGEVDVTRSLLMLPGVTNVGEGSGGLNVRGGNADQNLMLLDGSHIFFSSHLFGMFSAFNPDLLEDVMLYRGTIPARYGGRVSSVVSVRQRDGRSDRFGVIGGVGLVSSRLAIEGPLLGEVLTVIAGGRVSYVNWMMQLGDRADLRESNAAYADLTGRMTFRPSSRFRNELSGYLSTDSFRFGADTTYRYDTRNLSLLSSYRVADNLLVDLRSAVSSYSYGFDSEEPSIGFAYDAEILHRYVQPSLIWSIDAPALEHLTVEIGVSAEFFNLRPGTLTPIDGSLVSAVHLESERGLDLAGFASADVEWGALRIEGGLRYGSFTTYGPASIPVIDPEAPLGPGAVIDTLAVAGGEAVARYGGLEPRFGMRLAIGEETAVKAGYSRLHQNVHLLSNTTAPTPVDRWKLSDQHIRPQLGDQVTAGIQTSFVAGMTVSAEGYYRWLYDVPTYRPGASLLLNPFVAADLLDGDGRAYGMELQLERPEGRVTGHISYTLSRSERRAFATRSGEQVNFGDFFPSDFDRPHDLSISVGYHESDWVTWGVNFVYGSGRPITYPTGVYDLGDLVIPSYTSRNQARLPSYHRLDLSLTIDAPRDPNARFRGRWNATLYNIYARRNAYSIFFRQVPGTRMPQAYRLSTIGTIMPSLSYTFEF